MCFGAQVLQPEPNVTGQMVMKMKTVGRMSCVMSLHTPFIYHRWSTGRQVSDRRFTE
ncbi:unnamed protein product [Soboliphyme baturini]|uniref:Uncharacterized protein n=1 Tax=Soboliphyme baturini TaxID=241478 RepID=A0A183J893_9BILA|nr:unnamed protein product [Soboliphyme baturini]